MKLRTLYSKFQSKSVLESTFYFFFFPIAIPFVVIVSYLILDEISGKSSAVSVLALYILLVALVAGNSFLFVYSFLLSKIARKSYKYFLASISFNTIILFWSIRIYSAFLFIITEPNHVDFCKESSNEINGEWVRMQGDLNNLYAGGDGIIFTVTLGSKLVFDQDGMLNDGFRKYKYCLQDIGKLNKYYEEKGSSFRHSPSDNMLLILLGKDTLEKKIEISNTTLKFQKKDIEGSHYAIYRRAF